MKQLGPYVESEIPSSLVVKFLDAGGAAINLTGFSAKWVVASVDDPTIAPVVNSAVINAPATLGEAQRDWDAGDLAVGSWHGEMWVSDGTYRFCSERYRWTVAPALAIVTFP